MSNQAVSTHAPSFDLSDRPPRPLAEKGRQIGRPGWQNQGSAPISGKNCFSHRVESFSLGAFPFLTKPTPCSPPNQKQPHPQGRPTPENSAGPNRESRRGVGVFSCGHASDGETSAGGNPDHASSPRRLGAGETSAARSDSLAPPWMGHGATARRSFRPRARNNSFTKAFAEARTNSDGTDVWEGSGTRVTATETGTTQPLDSTNRVPAGVVAPTPLRPVVGVAGVPVASRTDTTTPPLPFAVTNTTAAGTTPGSPGAGAAAACTLLALLMTAGAKGGAEGDVSQAVTAAPTSCLGTGTSTGTTGNPRKRPFGTCVSGVQPGPDTDAAVDTASAPRLKKTKTKTAASKFVPAPQRAAHHDTDTNEPYHGPDIVPNTVMYNAASCAAAKRRLLPSRGGGTQKVHRPWTPLEVEALVEGVSHYGRGQWADIKSLTKLGVNKALELRSAVDLKDKWRNILRIAMLPVLYKRREAAEVPFGTLQRVREIAAAKHPQPGGCGNAGAGAAAASDTDCDSANPVSQPTLTKGQRRSKHHSPWTLGESEGTYCVSQIPPTVCHTILTLSFIYRKPWWTACLGAAGVGGP